MGNLLLEWLEKNERKRIIPDRDGKGEYMHRYYLMFRDTLTHVPTEQRKKFPFNLFLHKIMLSDEDYHHDHPWWYVVIILKGGYWEYTPQGKFWRGPGSIRFAKATQLHHVELRKDENGKEIPNWSLFFHGPRQREWGFIDPKTNAWVRWDIYLERRKQKAKESDLIPSM